MSDELIELEEEEHTSQLTSPVFKRIVSLLKPHWKWVLGFFITIMLTSVLDAYFTYLNKEIVDTGITMKDKSALMSIAILYGTFQLMQAGFVFTFIYLAGVLGERVQYDLRKMLFNHLQNLSLSYYAQNAVGRLIARVTSDTGRVSDLLTWGVVDTAWAIMNITTSLIFMAIINWKLALIAFLVIPASAVQAQKIGRRIKNASQESQSRMGDLTSILQESFSGIKVIKAFALQEREIGKFVAANLDFYRFMRKSIKYEGISVPVMGTPCDELSAISCQPNQRGVLLLRLALDER